MARNKTVLSFVASSIYGMLLFFNIYMLLRDELQTVISTLILQSFKQLLIVEIVAVLVLIFIAVRISKKFKKMGFKNDKSDNLFIVTTFLFSDSVDNLKDRMRRIESEIKQKNSRIQSIDFEKINIEKQIDRINKDIKNRENKSLMYQNEIKTVNKSIDYGQRNLGVSDRVLDRKSRNIKQK